MVEATNRNRVNRREQRTHFMNSCHLSHLIVWRKQRKPLFQMSSLAYVGGKTPCTEIDKIQDHRRLQTIIKPCCSIDFFETNVLINWYLRCSTGPISICPKTLTCIIKTLTCIVIRNIKKSIWNLTQNSWRGYSNLYWYQFLIIYCDPGE